MIDPASEEAKIRRFLKATNVQSSTIAARYVKDYDGDVEAAILAYCCNPTIDDTSLIKTSISPSPSLDKMIETAAKDDENQRLQLTGFTFVLPSLSTLPRDFRVFLYEDLLDMAILRRLEKSGHLNWWHWNGCGGPLFPLKTIGDGNCLLHAAALGMWGTHDRHLILRSALCDMFTIGNKRHMFWRRWRWSESKMFMKIGVELSEEQWHSEWDILLDLASAVPIEAGGSGDEDEKDVASSTYHSLEAVHVFALAHVIRRPIIVVSDTVVRDVNGVAMAPLSFGGIYLPLEHCPTMCHRTPLVLCYDCSHFSPLIAFRKTGSTPVVPILTSKNELLPVHFATDPGADFTWWKDEDDMRMAQRLEMSDSDCLALVCRYMDIFKAPFSLSAKVDETYEDIVGEGSGGPSKRRNLPGVIELTGQFKRIMGFPDKEKVSVRVTMENIGCTDTFVGVTMHLIPHRYVEPMVRKYLSDTKRWFETPSTSKKETCRLYRGFSNLSLDQIACIGKDCDKEASQSTNFMCASCMSREKSAMTSLKVSLSNQLRSAASMVVKVAVAGNRKAKEAARKEPRSQKPKAVSRTATRAAQNSRPSSLASAAAQNEVSSANAQSTDSETNSKCSYQFKASTLMKKEGSELKWKELAKKKTLKKKESNRLNDVVNLGNGSDQLEQVEQKLQDKGKGPEGSVTAGKSEHSKMDKDGLVGAQLMESSERSTIEAGDAPGACGDVLTHTLAVLDAKHPSECITTRVSSIEDANGVTHYYMPL